MSSRPYSADEFRRRALQQAGGPIETAWRDHGDFLLNPGIVPYVESLHLKDAAVLVPVVDDGDDASVIFTQRTSNLRKHSGQVAFPGGAVDPEDLSIEVAAIREAEEEIGLDPRFVETVARLPHYMAMSGFSYHAGACGGPAGFVARTESAGSGKRVRRAVVLPHESAKSRTRKQSLAGRGAPFLPYALWRKKHLGITAGIVRMLYERLYA